MFMFNTSSQTLLLIWITQPLNFLYRHYFYAYFVTIALLIESREISIAYEKILAEMID